MTFTGNFWANPARTPKLSFQWYMEFGSGPLRNNAGNLIEGTTNTYDYIQSYTLRSFQRPSYGYNVTEYKTLNDVQFLPETLKWNPIEIVLIDGQQRRENNASKLYNILKKSGYSDEMSPNEFTTGVEKANATRALGGQVRFRQINADGNTIETWTLINPFIQGLNFGQGNYTSEEIVTLSVTLRYDKAVYRRAR